MAEAGDISEAARDAMREEISASDAVDALEKSYKEQGTKVTQAQEAELNKLKEKQSAAAKNMRDQLTQGNETINTNMDELSKSDISDFKEQSTRDNLSNIMDAYDKMTPEQKAKSGRLKQQLLKGVAKADAVRDYTPEELKTRTEIEERMTDATKRLAEYSGDKTSSWAQLRDKWGTAVDDLHSAVSDFEAFDRGEGKAGAERVEAKSGESTSTWKYVLSIMAVVGLSIGAILGILAIIGAILSGCYKYTGGDSKKLECEFAGSDGWKKNQGCCSCHVIGKGTNCSGTTESQQGWCSNNSCGGTVKGIPPCNPECGDADHTLECCTAPHIVPPASGSIFYQYNEVTVGSMIADAINAVINLAKDAAKAFEYGPIFMIMGIVVGVGVVITVIVIIIKAITHHHSTPPASIAPPVIVQATK